MFSVTSQSLNIGGKCRLPMCRPAHLPTCPSAELPIFSSASALRMAFMRNSQEWMAFAAPSRAMLALK
jgi:hypothetical protein